MVSDGGEEAPTCLTYIGSAGRGDDWPPCSNMSVLVSCLGLRALAALGALCPHLLRSLQHHVAVPVRRCHLAQELLLAAVGENVGVVLNLPWSSGRGACFPAPDAPCCSPRSSRSGWSGGSWGTALSGPSCQLHVASASEGSLMPI